MIHRRLFLVSFCLLLNLGSLLINCPYGPICCGQSLEEELKAIPLSQLTATAREQGDASRGAILFHQPQFSCSKCHSLGNATASLLGPDLTNLGTQATDEHLVESVLCHQSRSAVAMRLSPSSPPKTSWFQVSWWKDRKVRSCLGISLSPRLLTPSDRFHRGT